MENRKKGSYFEQKAKQLLLKNGLFFVAENVSSRFGEIDLIMKDSEFDFIFIEVKFRKNKIFGHAAESITFSKQQKIIQTAKDWMQKNEIDENQKAIRFDAFIFNGNSEIWLKNAFF